MASTKERQRWEMIFRRAQEMNTRQRAAINRLLLMNTECMAALYEIAQMDELRTKEDAIARARAAIETVERLRTSQAAADAEAEEQLKDDGGESAVDEEKHDG